MRWQLDPLHSAEGAPVPTKTLSRLISLPREGIVFRRASALAGNGSMLRMEAGISMEGESINPFPQVDLSDRFGGSESDSRAPVDRTS